MSNREARTEFLARLGRDKLFQMYVQKPIEAMRRDYEEILKDVSSSEGKIRYAQGALEVLDWHKKLFDSNHAMKERSVEDERRDPTYTTGRYCT